MRQTLSARLIGLLGAGALLAACGDNLRLGTDGDDTQPIDGGDDIDSSVPPDMAEDTVTGTITFLEVEVLGVPQLGKGPQVGASFFLNGGKPPLMEESPGSPIGCKAWEYTPAEAADLGLDQGAVSITVDNDPNTDGNQGPAIPTCVFVPTRGYICPDATQSPGGVVAGVQDPMNPGACFAGVLALADTDMPFTFAVTDGRYVNFSGTGSALLDGFTLPIVNKVNDATVVFAHPGITSTTCTPPIMLPDDALHTTLGGVGPIPTINDMSAPEGVVLDAADITVTLTSGGDGDVPTFTANFDPPTGPGDDFDLTAESAAVLADIPVDGSEFTVSCDETGGCGTGTGDGVVLNIVTTDTPVTGLPGTSMPPPTTKRVQVRCAALASTSVTVPAAYSALLMTSGATRIQATFIRGELGGNPEGTVNVVAGHAITAFTTVPQSSN